VETVAMVIDANPVPLRADSDGTIRVVGTRLTLDTIVTAYRDGAPPEEIVKRFPDLSLPDSYAVIGYYLRNRGEVEAYLDARREAAEAIRRDIEGGSPPKPSRDELLARRAGK
jgi:uncharacterized protein (DUF433 family)